MCVAEYTEPKLLRALHRQARRAALAVLLFRLFFSFFFFLFFGLSLKTPSARSAPALVDQRATTHCACRSRALHRTRSRRTLAARARRPPAPPPSTPARTHPLPTSSCISNSASKLLISGSLKLVRRTVTSLIVSDRCEKLHRRRRTRAAHIESEGTRVNVCESFNRTNRFNFVFSIDSVCRGLREPSERV